MLAVFATPLGSPACPFSALEYMEELVAFASVLGGGDAVLGDARTVSILESAGGASRERMTVVL